MLDREAALLAIDGSVRRIAIFISRIAPFLNFI